MKPFQEYLLDRATDGRINQLFESAMYSLADELEQIVKVLTAANVPFEVIGGMAVNAHLFASGQQARAFVTKDVDLLVQRSDLPHIILAAEAAGYSPRKIMGGFMLIRPGQRPAEAVHLVFAGEKSKSSQPLPHPPIGPESKQMLGIVFPVARLNDLVRMKLTSFRAKDLVHLQILDACGLITPQVEQPLPAVLKERLVRARRQLAEEEPDVD